MQHAIRFDLEHSMTSFESRKIFRFFFLNISDGHHVVVTSPKWLSRSLLTWYQSNKWRQLLFVSTLNTTTSTRGEIHVYFTLLSLFLTWLCGWFSKSTRPLSLYLVPIIWGNNVDVHFDFILTLTQQNLCNTILMIYFWFMCMATSLYWLFKTYTPYSYCYIYRGHIKGKCQGIL